MLLGVNDGVVVSGYWLDANLKLIAAVSKKRSNNPVVIPMLDAERAVQAELAYWAAVADNP